MKLSELGLRGDRCVCARCGERFNSTAAFDAHRTGKLKLKAMNYGRRCLLDFEMVAKGMIQNAKGFWLTPRRNPRRAPGTPAYPLMEPRSRSTRYRGSPPPSKPLPGALAGVVRTSA